MTIKEISMLNVTYMRRLGSGKLIEYLSQWWDPSSDSIPERMEELWIDMYERGYIEIDDVFAVQMWLKALIQVGYKFPPLKRMTTIYRK